MVKVEGVSMRNWRTPSEKNENENHNSNKDMKNNPMHVFLCFNLEMNYSEGKKPEESYKDISTLTKAACTRPRIFIQNFFSLKKSKRVAYRGDLPSPYQTIFLSSKKSICERSRRHGWCTFFMILFKEPKTPTDHVRLMHKLETLDRHWASSSKLTHKVLHEQLTHKLETKIYGSIPRLYQFIFYRNFRFDFKFQDTVLYWTSLLFLKTQKT